MCGFIGCIHGSQEMKNEKILKEMLGTITHRGPDDQSTYIDDKVSLGFSRLSVLDLRSAANQPLVDEGVILVFNGEIYNYRDIRAELMELGFKFSTTSDTEVLLKGYLHFGEKIIEKLRGMFAFLIWDKPNEKFIVARDPFGIKPLYYTKLLDESYLFGSEIKSFLKHPGFVKELNKRALKPYLTFQYSVLDETFFKGVYRVHPGTYMVREKDEDFRTVPYFSREFKEQKKSYAEYIRDIQEAVAESVEVHRVSDVPVGSFLSGGIDSSYITSLLKPQKAFTIGFKEYEEMFDETKLAIDLAGQLDVEIKQRYVSAQESFDVFPAIQWHMDEPHSDPSIIPLYFLNEMASKEVTVILSGEGADELFGGYEWYQPSKKLKQYRKLPKAIQHSAAQFSNVLPPANPFRKFFQKAIQPIEERFIGHAMVWSEKDALGILKEGYQIGPSVQEVVNPYYLNMDYHSETDKMQTLDLELWLPRAILLKADKMSMAHSIELRVPFLDKKVFETAKQLPENMRVDYGKSKVALRDAAIRNLPEDWAKRKKLGFPVPIRHWIREEKYYKKIQSTFQQGYVKEFFDQPKLLGYLEQHYQNEENYARYIWTIYSFCVWYEQYFLKDENVTEVFEITAQEREYLISL
ncbi:asparagine synthase (glutamine-hydrolyzing) [Planococcus sp. APC 3906]|uniref:asparagine synthase (glutamine-hydrolyzing) n=1 Tax=Planococcus sp. APC 3906 TaxID=3035194 RepID=UPI0025B5CB07|nr:asparagine synthase (glutamine-hydrolyzing) [Planococcus sp. APC 3906]MDN3449428.1 asparagine synthase (glutamine-hydrolyzing) [Planococcus sp. APC 3906]